MVIFLVKVNRMHQDLWNLLHVSRKALHKIESIHDRHLVIDYKKIIWRLARFFVSLDQVQGFINRSRLFDDAAQFRQVMPQHIAKFFTIIHQQDVLVFKCRNGLPLGYGSLLCNGERNREIEL